ncbi:hypothetical protein CsatB_014395 [Cannabis sativa]
MSKTKSSSKKGSNLLMCFRPGEVDSDRSGRVEPVVAYIAMRKKGSSHVVLPAADEKEAGENGRGMKKVGSRRFSSAWKAVNLFEVSTANKKSNKGKLDKKASSKLISESARFNYRVSTNNDGFDFGQRILSRSASALATSSSALTIANSISNNTCNTNPTLCSSCSSSLITQTTPFDESKSKKLVSDDDDEYGKGYKSSDCGLVLMLLILFVLVFWGRICAILFTSTWLFLIPRWMQMKKSFTSSPSKSSECKGKIVKEEIS